MRCNCLMCKKKDLYTALFVYTFNLCSIRNTKLIKEIQSREFYPLMTE